jgi:hypothetical protein
MLSFCVLLSRLRGMAINVEEDGRSGREGRKVIKTDPKEEAKYQESEAGQNCSAYQDACISIMEYVNGPSPNATQGIPANQAVSTLPGQEILQGRTLLIIARHSKVHFQCLKWVAA